MAQPDLIPMPFAENATPGTIEPIEATTPTVPQDATWSAGFPQVTMQPLASGGIPPRGQNFNGVLNALSQHIFHMQGGGQYKWDAAHGPYSIGDVLQSDDGLRSYVSAIDNNTDNFNTTPASIGSSWLPWSGGAASELIGGLVKIATVAEAQALLNDADAITPKKLADALSGPAGMALVTGRLINVRVFDTNGTYTYTPTSGTRAVVVEVQGGGGGGGGAATATSSYTSAGGGGAGGTYASSYLTSGFSGVNIVVGSGGGPGGGGGGAASAGGTSSFGALISAPGGEPGSFGAAFNVYPRGITGGGTNDYAIGGNIKNLRGGRGRYIVVTGTNNAVSSAGGASFMNPADDPYSATPGIGSDGHLGSGGRGGMAQSGTGANGGRGGDGAVIIWEYA